MVGTRRLNGILSSIVLRKKSRKSYPKVVNSGTGGRQPLFSDEFQPLSLTTEGPVKYVREDVQPFRAAKNAPRRLFARNCFLDLRQRGFYRAKQELGR